MPGHDIIVIGASTGGIEALRGLLGLLPGDLAASLFIVVHIPPDSPGILADILARAGRLPTATAIDGEAIIPGRVYVAPPDHHLLLEPGMVRVLKGPQENYHRPAVDPLFRSAALWYGPRVIGVVLSGALDDGTVGLRAVTSRGGIAVVQDPDEAQARGMPTSAIENVAIDHTARLAAMAPLLARLAREPAAADAGSHDEILASEVAAAKLEGDQQSAVLRHAPASSFTCPHCGGTLWELREGELIRYRCHTGHAFTANSLSDSKAGDAERALWIALRALEEQAGLFERIAERAQERKHGTIAARFQRRAQDRRGDAMIIRNLILQHTEREPPAA